MSALRASDLSPAQAKAIGVTAIKRSKYRAQPTWVDGIRFASKRESQRYGELMALVKVGVIENLQLQPSYPIALNGIAICVWRGDFRYRVLETGAWVIEDAKGVRTPVYKLKKKLVEALYGISIQEV